MYIISANIKKSDDKVYLIKTEIGYIWTLDVSKIKLSKDSTSAAIFLSEALNHKDDFENFNMVDILTMQIYRLDMNQI